MTKEKGRTDPAVGLETKVVRNIWEEILRVGWRQIDKDERLALTISEEFVSDFVSALCSPVRHACKAKSMVIRIICRLQSVKTVWEKVVLQNLIHTNT